MQTPVHPENSQPRALRSVQKEKGMTIDIVVALLGNAVTLACGTWLGSHSQEPKVDADSSPLPSAPAFVKEPNAYTDYFLIEKQDGGGQEWALYSLHEIVDNPDDSEPGFYCWSKEEAIALARRLDPIEARRIETACMGLKPPQNPPGNRPPNGE